MENNVGIIIGRFQVPELHEGHKYLINTSLSKFDDTIVFLGETKTGELTAHDPLPFEARRKMLVENFPSLESKIYMIRDIGDYEKWVRELDKKIDMLIELNIIPADSKVWICGSRDSVAVRYKRYGGKNEIEIIPSLRDLSGTKTREEMKNYKPEWTAEERKIITWFLQNNG